MLGAVCPETGKTVGMISPHVNTAVVNVFLSEMSRQIAPGKHVVLVWDQAGFHTAGHLNVPPNITLLPLPPYSPELHPVENAWRYLRSHYCCNREYADWVALSEAACQAWQEVCLALELIKPICRTRYIEPFGVRV